MSGEQRSKFLVDYGYRTHPGGKKENEDCLNAHMDHEAQTYCFVIADGLGGSKGGKEASELAVASILSSFGSAAKEDPVAWLNEAFQAAHDLLRGRNKADGSRGSMKTTCVAAVILDGKAYWASVGDSRIYVMRGQSLLHRSKDHSVVQVLLDMGEIRAADVRTHPDRNRVLKALGMEENLKPAISPEGLPLQPGDCLLLCTDGFWEYINDKAIVAFMGKNFKIEAQKLIDALFRKIITTAREVVRNEHHDNLSAQLIMIR
jgi:PPM family protein phosphatase